MSTQTFNEWGSDYSDVYDITKLNISCSKFISADRPSDKYNTFGRNTSAQERRQALVPWVVVSSKRKNLDTYDNFQFKMDNDYIWSDSNNLYHAERLDTINPILY